MTGIVVATVKEAEPLIALLDAQPVPDQPFETWRFGPDGWLVVCGMGRAKAEGAAEHLITALGVTRVVNAGICGALNDGLAPGTVLAAAPAADDWEACCRPWAGLPKARLATVDEPVFQAERRRALAAEADVVDMEGSAVVRACERHGVPWHLVKGVSDLAGEGGRDDLQRNLSRVSRRVAETVVAGLANPVLSAPASMAQEGCHSEPREESPREGERRDGSCLSSASSPSEDSSLHRVPFGMTDSSSAGRDRGGPRVGLRDLLRFVKVEHSLFSLPLLFAGAWLGGGGGVSLRVLGLIVLAGVGARTLGMAMNRILDRRLDAANERTAGRELPSGRMPLGAAVGVALAGLVAYLAACAALNPLCLKLSPVPAVPLLLYPLLKRFTSLCHFGIGLCMALAPLCAFVAAAGHLRFTIEAVLLAVFAFCWISGFDIIYALQDIASDRRTGVRSLPASLGPAGAQVVAAAVHALAVGAACWLWYRVGGGAAPGIALAVSIVGFALAYCPRVPLPTRFFPVSVIAGVAGALVPLLGDVG